MLVAGDDAAAKETFSATVTAGGLRVLDAGTLSRARELEATALLQMGLAAAGQISWTNGFAVVK
ncbi:oxidoreductase [Corynebacterium variabile]|uniref:oxidoreductase n=1 Tax=Corynebacterium variabile TaxID=1727 RepID=UPI003F92595B